MVKLNSSVLEKYFLVFSNATLVFWLVEELDLLLHRVNDMVEFRIDAVLHEMSTTTLCVIPEDEPCTCEEFVNTTKVCKICVARSSQVEALPKSNVLILKSLC